MLDTLTLISMSYLSYFIIIKESPPTWCSVIHLGVAVIIACFLLYILVTTPKTEEVEIVKRDDGNFFAVDNINKKTNIVSFEDKDGVKMQVQANKVYIITNPKLQPYIFIDYKGKKVFVEINIPEPKYLVNNKSYEEFIKEESEDFHER